LAIQCSIVPGVLAGKKAPATVTPASPAVKLSMSFLSSAWPT
jgi:hypothetical protein